MAEDRVSRILDPYPVTEVLPEWNREREEMGSKRKFWYRRPGPEEEIEWLFKFPQPNTGQHWSEKIAAEVASVLEIPHARVELAVFSQEKGSVTKSFADNGPSWFTATRCLSGKYGAMILEKDFVSRGILWPTSGRGLDVKTINDLDRVPTDWMSPTAREFAIELMRYNVEQLSEIFR